MSNIFKTYLRVFSESRYVLLINLTDKIFSFVIFLLLARNFPTEIYGSVVTLFTLSVIFVTIFDFGLPIFLQREISINKSGAGAVFSRIFSVNLIFFISYFILSALYFKIFYSEIPFVLFAIIALMIYVTSLVNVCNKALSGLNDFKSQFTAFTLPRVLIAASFLIGIYVYPLTLNLLMLIMFGGFFLNFVLVIYYLNKNDVKFSIKHFSLNDIKFILKISLPLGLTVIFNFLYDKIDVLLISVFKDFTEVAFYNVGYGLYKGSTMAFSFLLVPGFSMVSSLSHSKEDVKQFFNEHFRIILTICIIVSIFLLAGADLIVNIFYTDKFQSSVIVLRILSFGIIAIGLNNLAGIVINSMGYFKVVMYITLYGLVLNFVLNIVFIPRYGMLAASVVTVITEHFVFFTEYYYLKKILRN